MTDGGGHRSLDRARPIRALEFLFWSPSFINCVHTSAMRARQRNLPPLQHQRTGVWQEKLTLPNGRKVILRPISPDDQEPLRAGFTTLTHEEIRLRFMHPMTGLTPEFAHQLTHLDPQNAFALVIAEPLPVGQALVGAVARLSFDHSTGLAEFALLVAKPITGLGLGHYLMKKLIYWARRHRLRAMHGDVLRENTVMLNLTERLGFELRSGAGESGIVQVWLDLSRA